MFSTPYSPAQGHMDDCLPFSWCAQLGREWVLCRDGGNERHPLCCPSTDTEEFLTNPLSLSRCIHPDLFSCFSTRLWMTQTQGQQGQSITQTPQVSVLFNNWPICPGAFIWNGQAWVSRFTCEQLVSARPSPGHWMTSWHWGRAEARTGEPAQSCNCNHNRSIPPPAAFMTHMHGQLTGAPVCAFGFTAVLEEARPGTFFLV